MFITYVTDTTIDADQMRIVHVVRLGDADAQTPSEVSPYGIDGNPIKDIGAAYGETNVKGDTVCFGYFMKNRKAAPGELRTYCTDIGGTEKFYTWLKGDGTYEIGGNTDNMVRYSALQTAFNQLKSDHNTLVTKWNAFVAAYAPGSPTVTGTPATLAGSNVPASTADITTAKINEVKTIGNVSL